MWLSDLNKDETVTSYRPEDLDDPRFVVMYSWPDSRRPDKIYKCCQYFVHLHHASMFSEQVGRPANTLYSKVYERGEDGVYREWIEEAEPEIFVDNVAPFFAWDDLRLVYI